MQYRESCRGVFKKESILTVYGLYILESLMFFLQHKDEFELKV